MPLLRTPLARVRGLGSAGIGTEHFIAQRLTAILLVPLSLVLFGALIQLTQWDYPTLVTWIRTPWNSLLLALFILASLYHAQLGLQIIIEDYVHHPVSKFSLLILMKLCFFVLGLIALGALLHISLGGQP